VYQPDTAGSVALHGLRLGSQKGIVDKHQGTIRVMSAPGKGTAITVFFPQDGIGDQKAA
jgi:signal transduction histidine kinase